MLPATNDSAASDAYWKDRIDRQLVGFVDLMSSDGALVDAARASGFRTVLCVGNGISLEPHALVAAGFHVTVLELSPFANHILSRAKPQAEHVNRILQNRVLRPGGRLEIVTGDLRDASLCPGPFDVVIERRTLQHFPESERSAAVAALAVCVASVGIFLSEHDDQATQEPSATSHSVRSWFERHGWAIWPVPLPIIGRVAWCEATGGSPAHQ